MSDFENYKIDFENNKIQEFIKEMRKNDGILENRFFKFEKYRLSAWRSCRTQNFISSTKF